jgi:hypothetical protein
VKPSTFLLLNSLLRSLRTIMDGPPSAVSAAVTDIVFTSLALLAVLLRVYTRVFVVKNFGVDDYLMVGSMVTRQNVLIDRELVDMLTVV